AHFYCQSAYGTWLRRNIQQLNAWGYQSRAELIFIDINEALPPLSIVARLLDNDHHLCFVATDAEVLRLGLEGLLTQLDLRYRRSAQQKFERNLAFYVGESPSHPEYPTIGFGAFRNFQFNFRGLRVRGWALSAQSMERQMAEIKHDDAPKAKILRIFFDGIYSLACAHQPRPALYYVKSLALQALVNYAKQSGETLPEILPQLRSLGWNLLGSERHWQRFLEYRAAIQSRVPVTEPDSIGSLDLEADLLKAVDWRAICEIALSHRRSPSVFHGPGCLQNFLVGFCRQLSQVLFEKSWVSSADQADLYVADALGFPDFWGTSASFDKRLGLARPFFQELDVQRAHHQRL
ncbi:MAG: hypothetical protein NTX25_13160, partial [Proteobacteria bacterium]|nr:hypothetical protein [Pseudomonadota bacterium]